ncbi:MAG: EamA family transporter [Candidatus Sericytochromatia bacterium]
MTNSIWMIPAFITLFLYGFGQGLVKKWSEDVPPAKFCLFLILARTVVNLGYFIFMPHPPLFTAEGMSFMLVGILAYILDGLGWILYFESIVLGPITIVGTLSAAYPALTLLFAQIFLKESLIGQQYMGVAMVIFGCLGLSYSPPDPDGKVTNRRWIPLALTALTCWGAAQTLLRYSYSLPGASESNMAIYATMGGLMTLGLYGVLRGRSKKSADGQVQMVAKTPFLHSFLPMAMMAGGDLGVIIASSTGPASLVAPITGAYPLVTLGFAAMILKEHISKLQWTCLVILLVGIGFSTIISETAKEAPATPNTHTSAKPSVQPDMIPQPSPS